MKVFIMSIIALFAVNSFSFASIKSGGDRRPSTSVKYVKQESGRTDCPFKMNNRENDRHFKTAYVEGRLKSKRHGAGSSAQ